MQMLRASPSLRHSLHYIRGGTLLLMIAIYARVSTEEQAKHGFSLKDQIREGKVKAGTDKVLEYVDEGISGEFLDRPALTKLREDVRSGTVHKVICLDPDRLSRKLMNQLIISEEIESRAELVFVNGDYARTPEGQLFYQMRGAISQFEKAKINERMSRGRREKARQGRILRDFHVYGYDFDPETEQFTVNEREAAVVRLIFDLFTRSDGRTRGINGIAKYLNDHSIPAKHGGIFHRQVVRQMLMNRAYIGEFYQNKWNTEGMLGNRYKNPEDRIPQRQRPKSEWIQLTIPTIIDEEQFNIAEELLEQSRRRFAGSSKRTYLLSGLLRCDECGNTLTGRKYRNWGKDILVYTDRKATTGAKHPGCGTTIPCQKLDDIVWGKIVEWVGVPEPSTLVTMLGKNSYQYEGNRLPHIEHELEKLRVATKRLLNFLVDPELDDNEIREKLKYYNEKKQRLLEQHTEIKQKINEVETNAEGRTQLLKVLWERLRELNGSDIDIKTKKEMIRTIVREIRVKEQGQCIEIYTL